MITVAACVFRDWSLEILGRLLDAQPERGWRITRVYTPQPGHGLYDSLFDHDWYLRPAWTARLRATSVTPVRPNELAAADVLAAPRPAVVLCYGWSWKIPGALYLHVPCLVCHPSPLPRYRGGSPLQNQILAGETVSAVTILEAVKEVDHGPILAQQAFSLAGRLKDVLDRVSSVGADLTLDLLDRYTLGNVAGLAQEESQATVGKRRRPEESEITPEELATRPARYLYDKIRALQAPYPNAFVRCADGRLLYLTDAHLDSEPAQNPPDPTERASALGRGGSG